MRRQRKAPALLFGLFVFFALIALAGTQATGPVAGPRLLSRLAGAMFEVERWTPLHREDIEAAARDRERGSVEVTGLPIAVAIPSSAAVSGDSTFLANALAEAAGRRLYEEGRAAFIGRDDARGDISLSSPVRWAIALLEEENHGVWRVLLVTALAGVVASGAITIFTSAMPASSLLRSAALGGGAFLGIAAAVWVTMTMLGEAAGAPINVELARIFRDCAWMAVRAGAAVTGAAVLIMVLRRLTGLTDAGYGRWPSAFDEEAA